MAKDKTFTAVAALLLFGMAAPPAAARTVPMGKHDAGEIKTICTNEGGDYIDDATEDTPATVWSCTKGCKGGSCSVTCDKDGCLGSVPGKRAQESTDAIKGLLNGKLAEEGTSYGLIGLLGLAGLAGLFWPNRARKDDPVDRS